MSKNTVTITERARVEVTDDSLSELHPIVRRIFSARGISSNGQIDHRIQGMLSPDLLGGTLEAAELLYQMLNEQRRILIVADFDADGATSCALAMRALKAMGFKNLAYLVPNRFEYGYGLTPEIVALATETSPDLIITVDNGIASIEGVQAAKVAGCSVLVTDHHLQGSELPAADVIVNPNLTTDHFPSKNLAGVGVIFYVMVALRKLLREKGWFDVKNIPEPKLSDYLDLVALGTVADLVPLDKNNRILVEQGMQRIRSSSCNLGIQALLSIGNRSQHRAVTSDLGFVVGPRLNAAGRLDDMSVGIECLLATDVAIARRYAAQLDQLNRERKHIEGEMKQDALNIMSQITLEGSLPPALCLFDETWHQGVIGILAARVKERYHRPVIAFALGEQGGISIKGSARSIPGLHIKEVLDAIALESPGLMMKYGGHAMAAGMTLKRSELSTFEALFVTEVRRCLSNDQLHHRIDTDGALSGSQLNIDLAQLLREAAPWGQGFPEPLFNGLFLVADSRIVGGKHFKLRLKPTTEPISSHQAIDAIAFNQDGHDLPQIGQCVEIAYKLDINEFRGDQTLQLVIEHIALKSTH